MKRLSLFLGGMIATISFAQAATLQTSPHQGVAHGAPVLLGGSVITQMSDNAPYSQGGVSCSDDSAGTTSDNSWWRRFYLAEHGAPSSISIESVTVGAESGSAPVTIRLYAISHATPADTIQRDQLRLLGASALTMVHGNLGTTTIPVSGVLVDAINDDLVVEYHTDGTQSSAFYAGGNPTEQSHEAFISSTTCGFETPVRMSEAGFPDAHMILFANAGSPSVELSMGFAPNVVSASASGRLSLTLANPFAVGAALTADLVNSLPGSLRIADVPNASSTCGGIVTAVSGMNELRLSAGSLIPARGHCVVAVNVSSSDGGAFTNTMSAGSLRTDQGNNSLAASATLTVIAAGGNGIVRSGPLNRAVSASPAGLGTSFNIVTNAFNDAGPRNVDWDFNFAIGLNPDAPEHFALTYNTVGETQYLVDASGYARALQNGDEVGPASDFSTSEAVPLAPVWLAGTDGRVGVRFRCGGRLVQPVIGDFCYGYIRIATSNTTGFPAQIVETVFDGDGHSITVDAPAAVNPPSASIAPAALTFSVPANATRFEKFSVSNAPASEPLKFALAAQQLGAGAGAPALANRETVPVIDALPPRVLPDSAGHLAAYPVRTTSASRAQVPWAAPDGILYVLDEGADYTGTGFGGASSGMVALWLNRFNVFGEQTINSISVLWPQQREGSLVGLQANLLVYYDGDGDGDPRNAVRLGNDTIVTITRVGDFETYATDFLVPGAGDVYIGYVETGALSGTPTPLNEVSADAYTARGKSYLSINPISGGTPYLDLTDLSSNAFTGQISTLTWAPMNWMIRATGIGTACSGPSIPWLSARSTTGTVVSGSGTDITVTVDPAAGDLAPGDYTGNVCILSNDPSQPSVMVPVSLRVTEPLPKHSCSSNLDGIFCGGFESAVDNDVLHSGLIDMSLPRSLDGMSFNFARGDWSAQILYGDDFNPYFAADIPLLLFYWNNNATRPGANGGVAETAVGPYRVLKSGDTIGPESVFSDANTGDFGETGPFLAGVDGYLGIRFYNEETRQINYGYVHLVTTWPTGYPLRLVEYAFNKAGGPITIP